MSKHPTVQLLVFSTGGMKVSTTLYLLWGGSFAVTAQAAINFHESCDSTRQRKVTKAFSDASKMADTVDKHWNGVAQTSLKNYFPGVKSKAKIQDIRMVFGNIAKLSAQNFDVVCVHTYDDPKIFTPSIKCKNREVAYVEIQNKEATNTMVFCPPFFSSAIDKYLDESKTEICALKSNLPEQPYKTYVPAGNVPAGTYNRNYDEMIEWLAHAFPGKWALHELTHTLAIASHITSTKIVTGIDPFQKKGTTDVETPSGEVAYGKKRVKELKTEIAYENADSYAWMAWTVYRDVCKKDLEQGEACSLEKRAGTGTGTGKGKDGAATPGKGPGKKPCNGKPPAKKPPVQNPPVKNPSVKKPNPKAPNPGLKKPAPGVKKPAPAVKKPVKKPAVKKPAAKKLAARWRQRQRVSKAGNN